MSSETECMWLSGYVLSDDHVGVCLGIADSKLIRYNSRSYTVLNYVSRYICSSFIMDWLLRQQLGSASAGVRA